MALRIWKPLHAESLLIHDPKAAVRVVCTLGSVVFVSILLIRGVWSGILYLQESRGRLMNGFDEDQPAWTGAQPVT